MRTLIQRLLVSTAIGLVSLASTGQAMAASPHHKASLHHRASVSATQAPSGYQSRLDVAAIPPYPNYPSAASRSPRSNVGYDTAAAPSYPQWGAGYPVAPWGYPVAGPGINVAGLIAAVLGGAVPLHYGGKVTASSSGSFDYSPSPDTSVSDAAGWAAEQEANDATAAAIQQNDANLQALDQSISAAEEQNDEANAATQQYEINNGM